MAIPVEMPKMSDTMEEGVLVAWLAKEGEEVNPGDVIAQVETDKATMDLEAYDSGVLLKHLVGEGDAVPIGALIAVLGKKDEDISEVLARYSGQGTPVAAEAPAAEAPARETAAVPAPPAQTAPEQKQPAQAGAASSGDGAAPSDDDGRYKASPLARKLAKDYGVDLSSVQGSGPEGRIVKRDIEAAASKPKPAAPAEDQAAEQAPTPAPVAAPAAPSDAPYESQRISQMRKAISRRLASSKFTAPHFYLTVDVDMEKASAFREQLNELAEKQQRIKISYNDLITKACAVALKKHPSVNASYLEQEGEIRRYQQVHVAVAVAMDEGLITPVIRDADRKGLGQIAEDTRSLAGRARDKQLQPAEYEGSTFTTSNLGMFGIEEFTAIINPPNACILAIGAIRDVPVVKGGEVVPGKRMKLTLSCDHRIVDGATGAQFLATVQQYLEEPLNLLL